MATNSTSFTKTPQASDDDYWFLEEELLAGGYGALFNAATSVLTLDVMANDLGGQAKKLFSISGDDTTTEQELWDALKTADTAGEWEATAGGNKIRIDKLNQKIEYRFTDNDSATTNDGVVAINSLAEDEIFTDTFTYTIRLANGTLSWATVTITIQGTNDAPVITSNGGGAVASIDVDENQTAVTTVTATDVDLPADTLSYSILDTAGTDYAKFSISAGGVLTFVTAPDFENPEDIGGTAGDNAYVIDVQVSDGNGGFDVQTITVNVEDLNEAPVNTAPVNTVPTGLEVNEDTALTFSTANGNALGVADAEGDTLTVTLTATHGALALASTAGLTMIDAVGSDGTLSFNGSVAAINTALGEGLTFTPVLNYNGGAALQIQASDGVLSDTDTVPIKVNPVNDAPVANNDVIWMSNNTSLALPVAALLGNDGDIDGLTLSITAVTSTSAGLSVSLPTARSPLTGSATIQISTGTEGGTVKEPVIRTFTYTITDGAGGTSTGTVTVNVIAVDDFANVVDLSDVEPYQGALFFTKNGNDVFIGGLSRLNGVAGGSGDDYIDNSLGGGNLFGMAGNDVLIGGIFSDNLSGGSGNDIMDGGAGIDLLDFSDASGPITFALVQSNEWTEVNLNSVGLGVDLYKNIEGVAGSRFDDILTGSDFNDVLAGRGGDDTLDGGLGIDFLDLRAATGGVTFTLTQSGDLTAVDLSSVGLDVDHYKNMEGVIGTGFGDILVGSSENDFLYGADGNDILSGNDGNDTLWGGPGADMLTGGAGSDTFLFKAGDVSVDRVIDFDGSAGGDVLDISDLLIGYTGTADDFIGLREVDDDTILSVDRDGTGVAYGFQDVVVLQGQTGFDLATLILQGNIDTIV